MFYATIIMEDPHNFTKLVNSVIFLFLWTEYYLSREFGIEIIVTERLYPLILNLLLKRTFLGLQQIPSVFSKLFLRKPTPLPIATHTFGSLLMGSDPMAPSGSPWGGRLGYPDRNPFNTRTSLAQELIVSSGGEIPPKYQLPSFRGF